MKGGRTCREPRKESIMEAMHILHCNTNGGYLSCVFEPDNLTGQRVFNHSLEKVGADKYLFPIFVMELYY